MASYRIEFRRSIERDLRRIDRANVPAVLSTIDGLGHEPRPAGVKKLVGSQSTWRIRVGVYRVVYEIDDEVLRILVVRVGHRRDVYRD